MYSKNKTLFSLQTILVGFFLLFLNSILTAIKGMLQNTHTQKKVYISVIYLFSFPVFHQTNICSKGQNLFDWDTCSYLFNLQLEFEQKCNCFPSISKFLLQNVQQYLETCKGDMDQSFLKFKSDFELLSPVYVHFSIQVGSVREGLGWML